MVEPLFEESQRASGLVIGAVVLVLAIIWAGLMWKFGCRGRLCLYLGGSTAFVVLLLAILHMHTAVDRDGVTVRMFFVYETKIAASRITTATAEEYAPIGEFGGWGLRFGADGRAYTVRGDAGVRLTLTDGKKVLIGSQRPQELEAAIKSVISSE